MSPMARRTVLLNLDVGGQVLLGIEADNKHIVDQRRRLAKRAAAAACCARGARGGTVAARPPAGRRGGRHFGGVRCAERNEKWQLKGCCKFSNKFFFHNNKIVEPWKINIGAKVISVWKMFNVRATLL